MSMILDALTRAEHERQLEKQPNLKFVTPVKPQKKYSNNIWLWVGLVVFANALILFLVIRALSGDTETGLEMVSSDAEPPIVQQPTYQRATPSQPLEQETIEVVKIEMPISNQLQKQQIEEVIPEEVRPLAMEA
ncbi:MAG: hypothetical protein P8X88_02050, partial [Gammaproteobacteria bacterium]